MEIFIIKINNKLKKNMAKNTEKKSYNGYSYSDGAKFESCYDGKYTKPNEPSEPSEVSFNEMYFGQTEGIRSTISYKAPVDVAWVQPKPEPGPKPEPKKYNVTVNKAKEVSDMKPVSGEYDEGTKLRICDIEFDEGYELSYLCITKKGEEGDDVTVDYQKNNYVDFYVVADTQIDVKAVDKKV